MSADTEREDEPVATEPEHDHEHDHDHDHDHDHGEEESLPQTVDITDAGPCRKHLKVTVERESIDKLFHEKYTELLFAEDNQVSGFRPGKAPRKLIERRYKKEVGEQVKTQVLMASLEQLATENKINPLSPPDLDINQIQIPDEGPLIYEFDIEVAPEFDLPNYKGLKLRRPVHKFTDTEVNREKRRLLVPFGKLVPKEGEKGGDPVVALDDTITADVTMKYGDQVLNELKEIRVKIEKRLVLTDAIAEEFDKQLAGAKVGEERTVKITLSRNAVNSLLRGKVIDAEFKIHDIKTNRPPELNDETVQEIFGFENEEQLDEAVRAALDRKLEYEQRQSARQQILAQLAESQNLELPTEMLRKQATRTLQRRIMEMRNAGLSDEQIQSRSRLLQQDAIESTAASMKEHFVLQKIAELEKIEIQEDDIDAEIEQIAFRSDESARRVRSRLEKDDLIETLATELLERRALDLVLESAEYEEYDWNEDRDEGEIAAIEAQVVPGSAEDEEEESAEESESSEESKE